MAKLFPNHDHLGSDDRTYAGLLGTPEAESDTTFDSYLTKNNGSNENYRLRLVLRIHLKQDVPNWIMDLVTRQFLFIQHKALLDKNIPHGMRYDLDKKRFVTKSWSTDEWQIFVIRFVQQAMAWDRKFWLIPSADFELFDFDFRGARFRPNVECEFRPTIVTENGNPHTTVEAINLFVFNAYFRSHSQMMSSADVHAEPTYSLDPAGIARDHGNVSAVAHEVGHMLGLPHIGETKELPHCQLAIILDEYLKQDVIPAMWKGGSNGNGCYGKMGPAGDAENVMGIGSKFAVENAEPWLLRLPFHIRDAVDIDQWKVSLTKIPPQPVVRARVTY